MNSGIKTGRLGAISVFIGILLGVCVSFIVLGAVYASVTGLIYAAVTYLAIAVIWLFTMTKPMGWLWVFACVIGVLCPVFIPLLFIGAKRLARYYPEGYEPPHRAPVPTVSGETNGANSVGGSSKRGVTPKKGTRFATDAPAANERDNSASEEAPRSTPRFGKTTMDNAD